MNERTYLNAVENGKAEEFHKLYDLAVEKVKDVFGKEHPLYIDGKEVKSKGGTFEDRSPCDTRILLGLFQRGTREDARNAIRAGKSAFNNWAKTDYRERARVFTKAADLMAREKYYLAALMSFENGKNRYEAIADVDEAIDLVRWYCGEMLANNGFEKEMGRYTSNERTLSLLKPYGVWAVISPFNFPLAITAGMTTGAVLTGNTAVLKPASDTPLMALEFYRVLAEAGLPPGVLNYLTGPGSTVGQELVENQDVAGLVFTGSREVGLAAFRAFTSQFPKPIITELGGKNATIVSDKADLDKAAEGVAKAAFGFGGQKCSACSRVLVHRSVKAEFVKKLLAYTQSLKIGDPIERGVFMGPVINKSAHDKFQKIVVAAKRDGEVLIGGNVRKDGNLKFGFYVEPTIVDKLPLKHRFLKEELFLPVLAIAEFNSLGEAIEIANSVDYGLTGGIFSRDEKEVQEFFQKAETGTLYANRTMGATTGAIVGAQPFVGWKMSGISGKGAGGVHYLQQFMRERSQTIYL